MSRNSRQRLLPAHIKQPRLKGKKNEPMLATKALAKVNSPNRERGEGRGGSPRPAGSRREALG